MADIRRRRGLARDLCRAVHRIVRNPNLTVAERTTLLVSMPLARLRHGSGLWCLHTGQERQIYQRAYMEPFRRSFRALTGLSSRGLDDAVIVQCLGVLSAEQANTADLVRHAAWLLADGSPVLRELWFDSGPWQQAVQTAVLECARQLRSKTVSWEGLLADPCQAGQWARRFSRSCRTAAAKESQQTLATWQHFAQARDQGVIFLHRVCDGSVPCHTCPECEQTFSTPAALAAHRQKVHGVAARATAVGFGSRCEVCGTEYWATSRLRDHLRRSRPCLHAYEASDLPPGPVVHSSEKHAWRPACRAQGPTQWWASLRPSPAVAAISPAQFSATQFFRDWFASESSEPLEPRVRKLVEVGIRHALTEEDMPLGGFASTADEQGLARCALFAVQQLLVRSTGACQRSGWRVFVQKDRASFWPTGVRPLSPFPTIWWTGGEGSFE